MTHKEIELQEFAIELVRMHREGYITLDTWPKALAFVSDYYHVEIQFTKREAK